MAFSGGRPLSEQAVPPKCRYCGRLFRAEEIDLIRSLLAREPGPNRAELSRQVCDALGWLRPDGRRKDMACRVALLRMHREGVIGLPPALKGNANGRIRPRATSASNPGEPVCEPAGALEPLVLEPVSTPQASSLWNELIERYHYLGYKPLPGAQLRYLVYGGGRLLAALGFGAAAWKAAPRDRWIGWTAEERATGLHRVVNNARFLILPWVTSRNLASRILSRVARRLPADWRSRYGYAPGLLETFVERDRFRGTCYRAANWIHVGQTQGRGKLDREHKAALPVKDIFVYALDRHFRREFCASRGSG
jgi:hypothetical protein